MVEDFVDDIVIAGEVENWSVDAAARELKARVSTKGFLNAAYIEREAYCFVAASC